MSTSLLLIISVVFSVARFPACFSADQQYEDCLSPLSCGSGSEGFPNITYPFWGKGIAKPSFCGRTEFELSCKDNQTLTLEIKNLTLRVVSANLDNKSITVADESLFDGVCPQILNFNGNEQFTLNYNTEKINLYDCLPTSLSDISCQPSNDSSRIYPVFGSSNPGNCTKVGEIPMLRSAKTDLLQSNGSNQALEVALKKGFDLRYTIQDQICWACYNSSGICGSESGSGNFRCLCRDKPHNSSCYDEQG